MIRATLIDSMGDDLRVANAARVSFDKESEWAPCVRTDGKPCECWGPAAKDFWAPMDCDHLGGPGCLQDRDAKLISYLARHNHWTPFSHVQITLREDVPIFVARQRFKHMVGFTYNEVSRRYVDDEPTFYEPEVWRKRADNLKQGSSDEVIPVLALGGHHDYCLAYYQDLLDEGVAPEQARMVLPQSMMTSYYTTGSLAAFARAYKQRIDPHSQKEIRDLAQQWDQIIRPLFPVSWAALVDG